MINGKERRSTIFMLSSIGIAVLVVGLCMLEGCASYKRLGGGRAGSAGRIPRGNPQIVSDAMTTDVAISSQPLARGGAAGIRPQGYGYGGFGGGQFGRASGARDRSAFNTESYDQLDENEFTEVKAHPLSTFSIDVDTASYANVRRFLFEQKQLPPKGAVRTEELINYFNYDYPPPENGDPFSVNIEVVGCPWQDAHRIARIGLKGREIAWERRPDSNLVFLLDVSGSMGDDNKLPLVKQTMKMMIDQLDELDRVAIVVYAGSSGLVLPSTACDDAPEIMAALDRLQAGGSTNGGAGIQLAYQEAEENFVKGGINRVILATDGDFNVGTTSESGLVELIEEKAKSGVFLTALGFGMGNYKDSTLEKLANKGNGNYAYIDTINEARKALVEELSGTMITIAKDVKIQVEFNPVQVAAYRLIGYENRMLAAEDFNDDKKDAGEIGAGHCVTALYEIVPPGAPYAMRDIDPLKYQHERLDAAEAGSDELLTVKLRYKEPEGEESQLLDFPVIDQGWSFGEASEDCQFACAVATFGIVLGDSQFKGSANLRMVMQWAEDSMGDDEHGYREEFLDLVSAATKFKRNP